MGGVRGKLATQAGHAYLHSFWDSEARFPDQARHFKTSGLAKKITLIVPTVEDLTALANAYYRKCGVSLVRDAGLTVFKEPTVTCVGIGPIPDDLIGDDLKALKTLT